MKSKLQSTDPRIENWDKNLGCMRKTIEELEGFMMGQFINGLNKEVKSFVQFCAPAKLKDAMKLAQLQEEFLAKKSQSYSQQLPCTEFVVIWENKIEVTMDQFMMSLNEEVKRFIQLCDPVKLSDAVKLAQLQEEFLAKRSQDYNPQFHCPEIVVVWENETQMINQEEGDKRNGTLEAISWSVIKEDCGSNHEDPLKDLQDDEFKDSKIKDEEYGFSLEVGIGNEAKENKLKVDESLEEHYGEPNKLGKSIGVGKVRDIVQPFVLGDYSNIMDKNNTQIRDETIHKVWNVRDQNNERAIIIIGDKKSIGNVLISVASWIGFSAANWIFLQSGATPSGHNMKQHVKMIRKIFRIFFQIVFDPGGRNYLLVQTPIIEDKDL